MVGPYHPRVSLRFTVTFVGNSGRECPIPSIPIVIRYGIVIVVECALRLLVDDAENLINGVVPWRSLHLRNESRIGREYNGQLSFMIELSFVAW